MNYGTDELSQNNELRDGWIVPKQWITGRMNCPNKLTIFGVTSFFCITYSVTHKGWDFRDDCSELTLYVSVSFFSQHCIKAKKILNLKQRTLFILRTVIFKNNFVRNQDIFN